MEKSFTPNRPSSSRQIPSHPRSADDLFADYFGFWSPFGGSGGGMTRQIPSHPRSADGTFAEHFGSSTPFGGSDGGMTRQIPSHPRSADDLFAEHFGSSTPFGGSGGGMTRQVPSHPRSADDLFAEYFGFSSQFGGSSGGMRGGGGATRFSSSKFGDDMFGSAFGGGGGGVREGMGMRQQKAAPIENNLPCSLEELYKGTTKKMKISRKIADVSGKTIPVEEILTIEIKPGWKKGTKITFPEKGNERPNVIPADLVFTINEKPHSVYKRDGNDLIVAQKITHLEASAGYTVRLTMLDGRSLEIPINNIIHPDYEKVVRGEGMPLRKDPSKRGNLRIKFNIKFPTRPSAEQKV